MVARIWAHSAVVGAFLVVSTTVPTHALANECDGYTPQPEACFPHALCLSQDSYWDQRRSIVHIYGPDMEGTGFLINTSKCDDQGFACGQPYILTALHVMTGAYGDEPTGGEKFAVNFETHFMFGHEALTCSGEIINDIVSYEGAEIIAYDVEADLLLLRLKTGIAEDLAPYFLGWGLGNWIPPQGVVIAHSCGGPKRVSVSLPDSMWTTVNNARQIVEVQYWETGALASGASGAPLFTPDGLMFGLYTNRVGAWPPTTCTDPSTPSQDNFTGWNSINDLLPDDIFDPTAHVLPYDGDTDEDTAHILMSDTYVGSGDYLKVVAGQEVHITEGVHFDSGSFVIVEINP